MRTAMIFGLVLLGLASGAADAAVDCTQQFPVGTSYVPYCSNGKHGPAVFVIHGVNRNADDYLGYLDDLDTLVIAPEFQDSGPGLYWSSGWKRGNRSEDSQRVSSFEVLDRMVEMFHGAAVVGHSAGGQFVTRYAAGTRMQGLTYIVANPSSYMYLDDSRPVGGDCPDFNEYGYGLEELNSYMSVGVAPDYPDRNVIYMLGSLDTKVDKHLDTSCEANRQGRNRYDRGVHFYEHLARHYRRPVHRKVVVADVGHSPSRMLNAARPYLLAAIAGQGSPSSTPAAVNAEATVAPDPDATPSSPADAGSSAIPVANPMPAALVVENIPSAALQSGSRSLPGDVTGTQKSNKASTQPIKLPEGVHLQANIAYGEAPEQRMDVYLPSNAVDAPVIFIVHGGAWVIGDRKSSTVVTNKMTKWVQQGLIFISVGYRMVPQVDPLTQANDVARALAFAQSQAAAWGGNASRFVLMGHSAGAHLVSLLAADPQIAHQWGATPWLGTVSLDSAVYDVPKIMSGPHPSFYDTAFQDDPTYWRDASPYHRLEAAGAAMMLVCSTQRRNACAQENSFAEKFRSLGGTVTVYPINLSHREINDTLGLSNAYTEDVEEFLESTGVGAL
jgi:acetyl esterase/lipase